MALLMPLLSTLFCFMDCGYLDHDPRLLFIIHTFLSYPLNVLYLYAMIYFFIEQIHPETYARCQVNWSYGEKVWTFKTQGHYQAFA